jgi:protein-tyrosine phosphatase
MFISIHNFRDFGGYVTQNGARLKKGLLFRSGNLSRVSDEDLAALSSLGIKTIVDLRTPIEIMKHPDRTLDIDDIQFVNIPMHPIRDSESRSIKQLISMMVGKERNVDYALLAKFTYQSYAVDFLIPYSTILKLLANRSNLPILFHCTAGKDRTGVVVSIIQRLLGVSSNIVMHDYLDSNFRLQAYQQTIMDRIKFLPILGIPRDKFLPLFEARKEYLQAAFNQIEKDFGTLDAYFRIGLQLSSNDQIGLAKVLIEND